MGWERIAYDTFTDANATALHLHTGEAAAWAQLSATNVEIFNNVLRSGSAPLQAGAKLANVSEKRLQRIDAIVDMTATGTPGIMVQIDGAYNAYRLQVNTSSLNIQRVVAGVFNANLGTGSRPATGQRKLSLVCGEGWQRAYVDDVEVLAASDSVLTAAGVPGVICFNNSGVSSITEISAYFPVNMFELAGSLLAFSSLPSRPASSNIALPQVSGRDSAGNLYAYTKGANRRISHSLRFPHLSSADLTSLLDWHATTVRGVRDLFVWHDHAAVAHAVRFASTEISHREVLPGKHEVSFDLIEEVPL